MTSEPLEVAYIVGTYPTVTTTFIDREIAALERLGVEVDVISIRSTARAVAESPAYAKIAAGVTNLLPTTPARLARAHLYLLMRYPGRYVSSLLFVLSRPHPSLKARAKTILHFAEAGLAASLLAERRPRHIHAHFVDRATTLAMVVGRILDLGYSATAHANDIFVNPVLLPEKISNAEFMVTVSEFNKRHLLSVAPSLDPDHIVVLHPWVDTTDFVPAAATSSTGPFNIVSVGRLVDKKGHRNLIAACGVLVRSGIELRCTIVGDGPLLADLRSQIESEGLVGIVELVGPQPQEEVRRLVSGADLFALACVVAPDGDRDGIPVAIAEAMALAVPVISTELVGIGELVQPGSGLLAAPEDPAALAAAIESVYRMSPEERRTMGAAGRMVVTEHFDLGRGTERLAGLFARAARSKMRLDVLKDEETSL